MDPKAAVMVAKVPGFTPIQSTVALLANINPGARRNSKRHRPTLKPEAANFMFFSLYVVIKRLKLSLNCRVRPEIVSRSGKSFQGGPQHTKWKSAFCNCEIT